MKRKTKRGQEEILGFALIMIIVSVILLVFLSISLKKPQKESVESYEVENYLQSVLQFTTDCSDGKGFFSVQDLIFECKEINACLDGREVCVVLNSTLKDIDRESWVVGNDTPVKGYEMAVLSEGNPLVYFQEGNSTGNSKGSIQRLPEDVEIHFTVYY